MKENRKTNYGKLSIFLTRFIGMGTTFHVHIVDNGSLNSIEAIDEIICNANRIKIYFYFLSLSLSFVYSVILFRQQKQQKLTEITNLKLLLKAVVFISIANAAIIIFFFLPFAKKKILINL